MSTKSPKSKHRELQSSDPKDAQSNPQDSSSMPTDSRPQMWKLDDFDLAYNIGKGRFGSVFAVRSKKEKLFVAIKVLFKRTIDENDLRDQVKDEIEIQYHLLHPNILRLKGFFHDEHRVFIITEYAKSGSLNVRIRNKGKLDEFEAARYCRQVADALNYCHGKGVIHRDVKPENIFLDGSGNIKLADFGYAIIATVGRGQPCGTLEYMAPEIINEATFNHTIDNWAVGVLLFEMLDPPNYAKRSYEGNVLPPVQKSARLEPDISTARQAFERPLFPTQPFLEKAALDRRSYGESRFDSLDLPTRQVSESWRTNDKNLGSRGAERSYDKDSWVHSGSRGSSSEKNAANAVSSVWRSEPVPPKKVPLNKQRSYSPAPREDDNFDTEEMTKPAKLVREPDTATNKKKGSYETLMKVVMGSINPRGLNTSYPADREKEDFAGRTAISSSAERSDSSSLRSSGSVPRSLSSPAGVKDFRAEDLRNDSSAKNQPRWESWRSPSNNQSGSSSNPLGWREPQALPALPSDSWRSSTSATSKTESWRNIGKNSAESPWIKPIGSSEPIRHPTDDRFSKRPGAEPIRYPNDDRFSKRPGAFPPSIDRAMGTDRREYDGRRANRGAKR